jgi:3-hydroxybutyryl-CoA dehydratase
MRPAELIETRFHADVAAVRRYAELTQDFNPIHLDPAFAATTPMRRPIAHGMLSLNLIWQALAATLGRGAAAGARLTVRFTRPVPVGNWIAAGGTRTGEREYDIWVRTSADADGCTNGETVISGTLTLG